MDLKRFAVALVLLVSGSANASTVLKQTDGSVSFINKGPGSIDFTKRGTQFGMFNVNDLGRSSNAAVILNGTRPSFAVAEFTDLSGNWSVDIRPKTGSRTSFDNLTLSGSDRFVFGLSRDGGLTWTPDVGVTELAGHGYYVNFTDCKVLAVDVQAVPVPSAVWLFGSGLLGVIATARRRAG